MKKYLIIAPVICACVNPVFATDTDVETENLNDTQNSVMEVYKQNFKESDVDKGELYTNSKQDYNNHVQGYIGVGMLGQAINEKTSVNGTEIANADTNGFGINLNIGIKAKYVRFGLDISSTLGEGELSTKYYDYYYGYYGNYETTFDVNVVKYSLELAGIIKCSDHFDLEIGATIGRGRFQVDKNWSDWVTPYGLLLGGVINFNTHHALTLTLKGYKYSSSESPYEADGAIGEFVVGYRYSF